MGKKGRNYFFVGTAHRKSQDYFKYKARARYIHDNINVDYDVYTIESGITKKSAVLMAKEYFGFRNKMTRRKQWKLLEDELKYEGKQLDRDIFNP